MKKTGARHDNRRRKRTRAEQKIRDERVRQVTALAETDSDRLGPEELTIMVAHCGLLDKASAVALEGRGY